MRDREEQFRRTLCAVREHVLWQVKGLAALTAEPHDWRLKDAKSRADKMLDLLLDVPLYPTPPGALRRARWWVADRVNVTANRLRNACAAFGGHDDLEVTPMVGAKIDETK